MHRQLTIASRHQFRACKSIVVPEIRMTGKWLGESGFETGKRVEVEVKSNSIILTVRD